MTTISLTPKVLASLKALDATDDKAMTYSDLRRASGAKGVSFGSIFNRMEDARVVVRDYDKVHLTFAGMQALRVTPQ
jgi:hypothetical protein